MASFRLVALVLLVACRSDAKQSLKIEDPPSRGSDVTANPDARTRAPISASEMTGIIVNVHPNVASIGVLEADGWHAGNLGFVVRLKSPTTADLHNLGLQVVKTEIDALMAKKYDPRVEYAYVSLSFVLNSPSVTGVEHERSLGAAVYNPRTDEIEWSPGSTAPTQGP
jgi:hypothetical protein